DAETRHAGRGRNDRAGQTEAERVHAESDETRSEHDPLADGEIDHARRAVHDDEGQRDERVQRPGERAVHDERGEEPHAAPETGRGSEGAAIAPGIMSPPPHEHKERPSWQTPSSCPPPARRSAARTAVPSTTRTAPPWPATSSPTR